MLGWENPVKSYRTSAVEYVLGGNTMINVSFNVAKDDVLAFACHYYSTSPTVRSNRVRAQVTFVLTLTALGLLVLSGGDRLRPLGIGLLAGAGLFAVRYPSWYRSGLRKSAEKMIAESSYGKAFGRYTLALTEDGVASASPAGESKYSWDAINRVTLTPEYLFIFLAGPQGFPIPRAQVPDSAIQEMKAFVESHMRNTEPAANGGGRVKPRYSSSVVEFGGEE
jgi:hypothetical protein